MLDSSPLKAAHADSRPIGVWRSLAARWRWTGRHVRRHWLAAVLLAAGLVLRVLAQVAYRPVLFYIDTTRYLYNDGAARAPRR